MKSILNCEFIIIDTHNDTMMKVVDKITKEPVFDIGTETSFHVDIPKMRKGEVNIAYFAAFSTDYGEFNKNISTIAASINALNVTEKNNANDFCIAKNFKQIEEGLKLDKRIAIQTLEGGYTFNSDNLVNLIQQYEDLGVIVIAPLWNFSNAIGEGNLKCYFDDKPSDGGLTELGKLLIHEMNQRNIVVDVSHMSENTFWDVIKENKKPLIASHSGVYEIKEHARNLKDDQIKAIASQNGVVNVVFCRSFIGDENAGVSVLVDHIDHIVKVVGDEYVGLGSDFDGATMPIDLPDISYMGLIIEELKSREYADVSIRRILGQNNLRILEQFTEVPKYNQRFQMNPVYEMRNGLKIFKVQLTASEYEWVEKDALKPIGLFDGYVVPCKFIYETKEVIGYIDDAQIGSISEPYHIASIQFVMPDKFRYFCTGILEIR